MGWEPLPDDVAEWMGMDTAMAEYAVELADVDRAVEPEPQSERTQVPEQPRGRRHSHA